MWSSTKAFYDSKEWKSLRLQLIAERTPKCERCKEIIAEEEKIIGHHTIELDNTNVNDRSISLNKQFIELICFDCHNKEHKRFGYQIKKTDRKVYVVYGAPLCGKSSFVMANKDRLDLVVDMDSLYSAVTMLDKYDKPDTLKFNVLAIRKSIIDNIKTRYGNFNSAWIIGGYPRAIERNQLCDMLGATPIYIEATKEECMQRLLEVKDGRRDKVNMWAKFIDKWFEDYTK